MVCDVLILGGGAAGLACRAGLLGARSVTLLEREARIGGLLRVFRRGDYVFDTTVHVLFFRNQRLGEFLVQHLEQGAHRFHKRNMIWQRGTVVRYPYQYHIADLPAETARQCLDGFLERPSAESTGPSFRDWLLAQFGAGFYRHFFEPYNTKLYGITPEHLLAEPMVWTIPSDNHDAVIAGANAEGRDAGGAGACFYPRGEAGIEAVPHALERLGEGPIRCGQEVTSVDPRRKEVETRERLRFRYRSLVSSLPLPCLVDLIRDPPAAIRAAAGALAVAPVTVVRIGLRRSIGALPAHWTYFPDQEIPFYRLVRLEAISAALAPHGGSSLLLECPGTEAPDRSRIGRILETLGIIHDQSDIEVYESCLIRFGYVLFTPAAMRARAEVLRYLADVGIHTVGRYGEWVYGSIETSIVSGLRAARSLSADRAAAGLVAFASNA